MNGRAGRSIALSESVLAPSALSFALGELLCSWFSLSSHLHFLGAVIEMERIIHIILGIIRISEQARRAELVFLGYAEPGDSSAGYAEGEAKRIRSCLRQRVP